MNNYIIIRYIEVSPNGVYKKVKPGNMCDHSIFSNQTFISEYDPQQQRYETDITVLTFILKFYTEAFLQLYSKVICQP